MSNAGTVLDLLDRAREGLVHACHSDTSAGRHTQAHLAALRAAAAVIAARSTSSRHSGPRSVWEVLSGVAPELTEWAVLYAAAARRHGAVERGESSVSCREADDLVRASERFLEVVRGILRLPVAEPLPGDLAVISAR